MRIDDWKDAEDLEQLKETDNFRYSYKHVGDKNNHLNEMYVVVAEDKRDLTKSVWMFTSYDTMIDYIDDVERLYCPSIKVYPDPPIPDRLDTRTLLEDLENLKEVLRTYKEALEYYADDENYFEKECGEEDRWPYPGVAQEALKLKFE